MLRNADACPPALHTVVVAFFLKEKQHQQLRSAIQRYYRPSRPMSYFEPDRACHLQSLGKFPGNHLALVGFPLH
jgi:hypothetical protein